MPEPARLALHGRIVTMDGRRRVLRDGVVYVRGDSIAAIARAGDPAPEDFAGVRVRRTGGTLYPGLIDLHNHLAYNILPLWKVPRLYSNRDQWGDHPDYRRLISGPMTVLGRTEGYPAAIARYTECKCLFGGVTTSQGIKLNSNGGMSAFYRGFLRNPEVSDGDGFPAAHARIGDVAASDRDKFRALLERETAVLLHLSEGSDERARAHFLSLVAPGGAPALAPSLAGIHCVALRRGDFRRMHAKRASMVWSPLSNLLLYGQTADIAAARAVGIRIGLGADWSPSGSKSLLGELKVARVVARSMRAGIPDADLVAMATCDAAAILRWEGKVGSLEAGKRADIVVVRGTEKPAYRQLLEARESDIVLVTIDGVRRYGLPRLMAGVRHGEACKVDGRGRVLDLSGASAAPLQPMSLAAATRKLREGLGDLVALARQLEHPRTRRALRLTSPTWTLQLEEEEPAGVSIRTRFGDDVAAMPKRALGVEALAAEPLSQILAPLRLDPLTAADDPAFVDAITSHPNVPAPIRRSLKRAFAG